MVKALERDASPGARHTVTLTALQHLADCGQQGQMGRLRPWFGPGSRNPASPAVRRTRTVAAMSDLAELMVHEGKYAEAERLYRDA